jgi:hypothetical protein
MKTKLTTDELLMLLNSRYSSLQNGDNYEFADNYNSIVATLKDFVESFTEGRLEIKVKE